MKNEAKLQRYPDHDHNTSFFFAGAISTNWRLVFFCHRELSQQMDDPSTQLIEVDGWSSYSKIRNGDESLSGGTGPWISISFPLGCYQLLGDVWICLGSIPE